MSEPVKDENGNWTLPEGYSYPYCSGCGHRYFEAKPRKKEEAASGLCHWCVSEKSSEQDEGDDE